MLNEIKNSVKAKLYDSTNSPFLSSYIVSSILYNHQYILIYFGTFENKLSLLRMHELTLGSILMPILFALIYIYIYPYFLKKFYSYTLKQQKERNEIKQNIEDKQLLTIEQSREVRLAQYKLEEEIDKKDKKIEYFKSEIKTLETEKTTIEDNIFQKLSTKEDEIRTIVSQEYLQEIDILNKKIDNTTKELIQNNKTLKESNKQNKALNTTINEQINIINTLELNKNKKSDFSKYLNEFTEDEINLLEIIYTQSIGTYDNLAKFLNAVNKHSKMPEIKIKALFESLKEKGYMEHKQTDWGDEAIGINIKGERKALEIFG